MALRAPPEGVATPAIEEVSHRQHRPADVVRTDVMHATGRGPTHEHDGQLGVQLREEAIG